jgi:hypothetical protein
MRLAKLLLIGLPILLLALPSLGQCPQNGVYNSQGGSVELGTASESWINGQEGQIGNTLYALSMNDGAQWILSCPSACVDPILLDDTVDPYGNGMRSYLTEYCGGTLWLNGGMEDWSNGDVEYVVDLVDTNIYVTIIFMGGVPIGHVSNIELAGTFQNCESCVAFQIANATMIGEGYGFDFPAGYPLPVFADSCDPEVDLYGSYWDIIDIGLTISGCGVASQDSDWSQIKSLYR